MMALDYGGRRLGIAITDPTRTIAAPRGVIERSTRSKRGTGGPTIVPDALTALVAEVDPAAILVGIPFSMDGTAGEMAREARAFARALEEATGVMIIEWDERLSSARAKREIRAMDLPRGKRRQKGRTDEVAASLMLSDYLRMVGARGADGVSNP